MKLLIDKNEKIEVSVFVSELENGSIDASLEQPADQTKSKTIKFIFKKPNYEDSRIIIESSSFQGNIDPIKLQDNLLRRLLVDWDLEMNGEKIECTLKNINLLVPTIARTAASGAFERVQF